MTKLVKLNPRDERYIIEATWMKLSYDEQKRIHDKATRVSIRNTRKYDWIWIVIFQLIFFGISWLVEITLGLSSWWKWPLVLFFLLPFLFMSWRSRKKEEAILREVLSEEVFKLDVRPFFCLQCEYNLQGTSTMNCPECGADLASEDTTDQS